MAVLLEIQRYFQSKISFIVAEFKVSFWTENPDEILKSYTHTFCQNKKNPNHISHFDVYTLLYICLLVFIYICLSQNHFCLFMQFDQLRLKFIILHSDKRRISKSGTCQKCKHSIILPGANIRIVTNESNYQFWNIYDYIS